MEEELDPFDYQLAENLGMTVEQVRQMPNREYAAWQAFYVWRHARRELEAKETK
jgi:hypothetical protein